MKACDKQIYGEMAGVREGSDLLFLVQHFVLGHPGLIGAVKVRPLLLTASPGEGSGPGGRTDKKRLEAQHRACPSGAGPGLH